MLEADPTDRLLYTVSTPPGKLILGNYLLPLPPASLRPRVDAPYFYDGEVTGAAAGGGPRRVRISALFLKNGEAGGRQQWMLVQVARSMASRDSLVKRVLVDTLLPLSGLIVLITVLLWVGIRAGLAPLNRLRSEVEGRSPLNLMPLQIDAAPQEVRSLVQALNELLTSVRQNVSAQQRFIADAAHQLRTPIAGLQSQTEIALRDATDPVLTPRLQRVHRSAMRAAHLISQLLMLARAEPEALQDQDLVPTDLRALVRAVVADAVPAAARRGLDLGMDDTASDDMADVTVRASPRLLQEAVSNVLDNAIEYAGAGCEVTVDVRRIGNVARIVVSDNGPGIPADFQGDVFDRFVRATTQGTGCGLGLSIVREIILRHQGSVELQTVRPHGLAVVMQLPVTSR
jgi:two-component system sensor histidine kinase TctE